MGAEWAAQSPDPEWRKDGPILQRTSEFLKTDPDSTTVRFWAWATVFAQSEATGNVKTQARSRSELLKLGAVEGKDKDGVTMFQPPAPVPKPVPKLSPSPVVSPSPVIGPSPTN
jgi:hypothetical protein